MTENKTPYGAGQVIARYEDGVCIVTSRADTERKAVLELVKNLRTGDPDPAEIVAFFEEIRHEIMIGTDIQHLHPLDDETAGEVEKGL